MRKYWSIFRIQVLNSLAYPGALIGRSLLLFPFMWIYYQLWKVTFAAAGTSTINGLTLHDTLWYLMIAETVELSRPQIAQAITENVRDGSIAYQLSKPYDFMGYHFSSAMGETVFRAAMNILLGSALAWWLAGPPPDPRGWPLALVVIAGAWVLQFCMNAIIGLAAFVAEDTAPFVWIYQKFVFLLGGMLIPLDFYPGWLQAIARFLPFSSMIYGPARVFIRPGLAEFVQIFGMQIFWIALLGTVLLLTYRRGLAEVSVNGG